MSQVLRYFFLIVLTSFLTACALFDEHPSSTRHSENIQEQNTPVDQQRLGAVHFPVSCNPAAREQAVRGLALLHHMTYEGARAAFTAVIESDADCAMGYWGQAMTYIHPLWSDQPSAVEFALGLSAVKQAKMRGKKSDWERAYIEAAAAYYDAGREENEKNNLVRFEHAWRDVYMQFPDDYEAASFYALAHLATADPSVHGYIWQEQAAAIAQKVLEHVPDHPGAHHYMIHAYDYPLLAEKALAVARSYGEITADVAHALHMPTHIFTRLGQWQDSIVMNRRAADAAWSDLAEGSVSLHYFHALDYLIYAYLQRADDQNAKVVLETIRTLSQPVQAHIATAFALAAIPARFALERQQWAEAAELETRWPESFPWDRFPAMEAITFFAQALGAARSGNVPVAREALQQLKTLQTEVEKKSVDWAKQIEVKRLSAQAWLVYQQGEHDKALDVMRQSAALQAATEKHPVTPGAILPANELLADMYLEMGQYRKAQAKYLDELDRSPNRFNSMYGVARAAELAGDIVTAVKYYQRLIEMSDRDSPRSRLQYAQAVVKNSTR